MVTFIQSMATFITDAEVDDILATEFSGDILSADVYFDDVLTAPAPRVPFRYSVENAPRWVQDVQRTTRREHPEITTQDFRMLMLQTLLQLNLEPVYQRAAQTRQKGSQS
jgi:hypothetical protein